MRYIVFLFLPAFLFGCAAPEDKRPNPMSLTCAAINDERRALNESVETRERAENIQSAIEIATMIISLAAGGGLGGNNYGGGTDPQLPMDRERLQKLDQAFIAKKCVPQSAIGISNNTPTQ